MAYYIQQNQRVLWQHKNPYTYVYIYIYMFDWLRLAFKSPSDLQFEREEYVDVKPQLYLYLYNRIYYKLIPHLHIKPVKLQSFEMQI
jgi:hypothetical protein